jgi:hypothetical protein
MAIPHAREAFLVFEHPLHEGPRIDERLEDEARGARHALVGDNRRAAATLAHDGGAAMIRGHERGLGGSERHVEVALRRGAVDAERAGEPDRNAHGANGILDVAHVAAEVWFAERLGRCGLCVRHQRQSGRDGFRRAVVGAAHGRWHGFVARLEAGEDGARVLPGEERGERLGGVAGGNGHGRGDDRPVNATQ